MKREFFILGDAAGLVNVPSLKGIHYAMLSGISSAEFLAQKKQKKTRISFEDLIKKQSVIGKDLYQVRNVVRTLQTENKIMGFIKAGLMILSLGRFPGNLNPQKLLKDNQKKRFVNKGEEMASDGKADAVYLSGNKTRDDIPSHLEVFENLPEAVQDFYINFCPAGVYEKKDGRFIVNAPNCVDCKATDVLGPRWNPREGGSGPDYSLM